MATSIPSLRSNPIARVVPKRGGGSGKSADQFREELAKQEAESSGQELVIEDAPASSKSIHHPSLDDAEPGARLDIVV